MKQNSDDAFRICQNKRFNSFTNEMADVTAEAFDKTSNQGKAFFPGYLGGFLASIIRSADFRENDDINKADGLERLNGLLKDIKKKYVEDPFAKKNTEMLIKTVKSIMEEYENKNSKPEEPCTFYCGVK